MTKAYVVSYDLKAPGRDYTTFYDVIKGLGDARHPLESVWVVFVDEAQTIDDIYRRLHDELTNDDLLLIFEVKPEERQGWLASTFWQWMREKTEKQ